MIPNLPRVVHTWRRLPRTLTCTVPSYFNPNSLLGNLNGHQCQPLVEDFSSGSSGHAGGLKSGFLTSGGVLRSSHSGKPVQGEDGCQRESIQTETHANPEIGKKSSHSKFGFLWRVRVDDAIVDDVMDVLRLYDDVFRTKGIGIGSDWRERYKGTLSLTLQPFFGCVNHFAACKLMRRFKTPQLSLLFLDWCSLQSNFKPDGPLYNALIRNLGTAKWFQEMEGVFEQVVKNRMADRITFNQMILNYASANQSDKAMELFESMASHQVSPDKHTFGILIRMLTRLEQHEKAIQVYERMKSLKVKCDSVLMTSVITLYASMGKIEQAADVFHSMIESETEPPALQSFTAVISMYSNANMVNRVREAYQTMLKLKVQPDLLLYSILLTLYSRNELTEEVFILMDEMSQLGIQVNQSFLQYFIVSLIKKKKHADIQSAVSKLKTNRTFLCKDICISLLDYHLTNFQFDQVHSTLAILHAQNMLPCTLAFSRLLNASCRSPYEKHLSKIHKSLEFSNTKLFHFTRLLLHSPTREFDTGHWEEMDHHLNMLVNQSYPIRNQFTNAMFNFLYKAQLFSTAARVWERLRRKGSHPYFFISEPSSSSSSSCWKFDFSGFSLGAAHVISRFELLRLHNLAVCDEPFPVEVHVLLKGLTSLNEITDEIREDKSSPVLKLLHRLQSPFRKKGSYARKDNGIDDSSMDPDVMKDGSFPHTPGVNPNVIVVYRASGKDVKKWLLQPQLLNRLRLNDYV